MNGYQITFLTCPDRRHCDKPLAQWLVDLAREMDLCGAVMHECGTDFNPKDRPQGAHFPKLKDQTMEVRITASAERAERLFERLRAENVSLFYVKTPIEFGMLGENA